MNVAIVRAKDILKCILIMAIIFIIIFMVKQAETRKIECISKIDISELYLKKCVQNIIPAIDQINIDEEKENGITNLQVLYLGLNQELKMSTKLQSKQYGQDNIEKNKNEIEENDIENQQDNSKLEEPLVGVATQVLESNVTDKSNLNYNSVLIRNESEKQIDSSMLEPNIEINKKNIIIFHTHTTESYTPSELNRYDMTGTFRTTDLNYTVVGVGNILEERMRKSGFNVYHDKTYHDYPEYTGSYGRSLETVINILNTEEEYKDTDIIIDLHRDAIGESGEYAPTIKIGDEYAARLMLVIGTDGGGKHDNWLQNLKFAIKIQEKANELYPGLFKPIVVRNSRYNQHLGKAACIIEVGATGNKLEEAQNSMKYLSKVFEEVLK